MSGIKGRDVGATVALRSGQYGNGGRATDATPLRARGTRKVRRETPYRVAGTTAGQWTTSVAHNTDRIWRDER